MLALDTSSQYNCAVPGISITGEQCIVEFAAAAHGGIARMWFDFSLCNDGAEKLPEEMVLRMKHIMTMLDGCSGNFRPVINYGDGWLRLPPPELRQRPDGHLEAEWSVATPAAGKKIRIAFCYPYDKSDLAALLCDTAGFWHCDEIGVSQKDRSIVRLANLYGTPGEKMPGLYLIARQHAGETAGAWVLDGFLRYIAASRPKVLVWCVPFADTDGVEEGNYGKDAYPWDLNRAWGPHAMMRHENCVIANDMAIWQGRVEKSASIIVDFHSPGASESGCYAFVNEAIPKGHQIYDTLKKCQKKLTQYASANFILHAGYKPLSAWGTFADLGEYTWEKYGLPTVSLETSYFECGNRVMTAADYRAIGSLLAEQLVRDIAWE